MDYKEVWQPFSCSVPEQKNLSVVGDHLQHRPPIPPQRKPTSKIRGDPDYDNITDIYNRLDKTNVSTNDISVYTSCDCIATSPQLTQKQRELYRSQEVDTSDSEEEGEDIDVSVLLKMLRGLQNRPERKISTKAFLGVLESFISKTAITPQQVQEIWEYLNSENLVIKELSLLLLAAVCNHMENAVLLLDKGILDIASSILSMYGKNQLYPATVRVITSIVSHRDLKITWMEPILSVFVPAFLAYLRTEAPLDHKYPMCCFFLALSKNEEFYGIVEEQVIPIMALIKDYSAKLTEVYTGILMNLVKEADSVAPDLCDQGIIHTTASLLKEGPCCSQQQALSLIVLIANTDAGIASIVNDHHVVPYALCCIKHTRCRKVKAKAIGVISVLCGTRRLGLCKELMTHIADYLMHSGSEHPDDQRSRSLVKGRHERESQLWRGLDKLVEIICEILCKEAKVERDNLGSVTGIRYKPCIDMCSVRLESMIQCLTFLHNVCIWPITKSKNQISKIDLTYFTDSEVQRSRLQKVNRSQAQALWDIVGTVVMEILLVFSKKVSEVSQMAQKLRNCGVSKSACNRHKHMTESTKAMASSVTSRVTDKSGATDLYAVFEEREVELIVKILEFLLVISLCACKEFKDFTKKDDKKSPKKNLSFGRASKSDTCLGNRPSSPDKHTKSMSAIHRPTSATKLSDEDLTKKRHGELMEKEAATDRRLIRKCLYEAGIFSAVSPFIYCSHAQCQNLASQVLRCNIQPLDERVIASPLPAHTPTNASANTKIRPMSAVNSSEADRKLNIALHRMSPHIAEIMKNAIGVRVRPLSATIPSVKMEEDTEVSERLSQYVKSQRPQSSEEKVPEQERNRPVLDPLQPIVDQCKRCFLTECGPNLLNGLFSPSWDIKRASLLLLRDLVHYGDVSVHMKLSEFGCMNKLVDFLRVNTDDNLLEITGLIIVQILVSSDVRLKQVFNRHGGTRLLMAMSQFTSGKVKEEVSRTLKTVTYGTSKHGGRPSSAPTGRTLKKPPDIWDHIQSQWQTQDKVSDVLKQWYKHD